MEHDSDERSWPTRRRVLIRLGAALAVIASVLVVPVGTELAQADVPNPPAVEFYAQPCSGTTPSNPAVASDPGPNVPNLLRVWGGRLTAYNAGDPVILYNNSGTSGWSGPNPGDHFASNPVCTVRHVDGIGDVSEWTYCTQDAASACSWTDANGDLIRQGQPLLPMVDPPDDAPHLTADQQKLQAYIVQTELPIVAGTNWSGGATAGGTASNNDRESRTFRQDLVHCIDNPPDPGDNHEGFCNANMSSVTQARILDIIGGSPTDQLSATAPGTTVAPGANGQITVSTTLAGVPLQVDATGGTVSLCDITDPATLSGNTLTVDANAAPLPVSIDLCVTRATAGQVSLDIEGTAPDIANIGYSKSPGYVGGGGTNLCQIFALIVPEHDVPVTASAAINFAAALNPQIATSLVDQLDNDKNVAATGGIVIDTITYSDLNPSTSYVVSGELMDQATGNATGITGSTTFTSTVTGSGTVDVEFTIAASWAGYTLVAFEFLTLSGTPVADHQDINDAAQTIVVDSVAATSTTTTSTTTTTTTTPGPTTTVATSPSTTAPDRTDVDNNANSRNFADQMAQSGRQAASPNGLAFTGTQVTSLVIMGLGVIFLGSSLVLSGRLRLRKHK